MWLTKNFQVSFRVCHENFPQAPPPPSCWKTPRATEYLHSKIKKAFTLNAGRGSECKQNVRMSKDCQRVLELYYKK